MFDLVPLRCVSIKMAHAPVTPTSNELDFGTEMSHPSGLWMYLISTWISDPCPFG